MKSIVCTILAGCFLLGAVALHAYMTPVFCANPASDGYRPFIYITQYGRVYYLSQGAFSNVVEAPSDPPEKKKGDAFDQLDNKTSGQ
jgi:hypothetical protein